MAQKLRLLYSVSCLKENHNCTIMEACLKAGAHYIDIGGLYVETIKQVQYDRQFREAGLTAIIGIGGTPGVTNVKVVILHPKVVGLQHF